MYCIGYKYKESHYMSIIVPSNHIRINYSGMVRWYNIFILVWFDVTIIDMYSDFCIFSLCHSILLLLPCVMVYYIVSVLFLLFFLVSKPAWRLM